MKWIKAMTRRPRKRGNYITRLPSIGGLPQDYEVKYILFNPKCQDNYIDTKQEFGVEWLDQSDGWISVKKDLPDYDTPVLWITEQDNQFVHEIDKDNDFQNFQNHTKDLDGKIIKITHWQPLPPIPSVK